MITAAITVAVHEKTILTLKKSSKNLPTGLFTPNINKMKNPITVGGNTIGKVNIPSKIILTFSDFILTIKFAVIIPKKNVITIAAEAVLIDINIGESFIFISYFLGVKP
jgi:hypothetical protein